VNRPTLWGVLSMSVRNSTPITYWLLHSTYDYMSCIWFTPVWEKRNYSRLLLHPKIVYIITCLVVCTWAVGLV
jgi:hypothetical protein